MMKLFVWTEDILVDWGDGMAFSIGKDLDEAIETLLKSMDWKLTHENRGYWKDAKHEEHEITEGFTYANSLSWSA